MNQVKVESGKRKHVTVAFVLVLFGACIVSSGISGFGVDLANAATVSSTYTVYKSGSTYYTKLTSTGASVLSNSNFVTLMNSLSSKVRSGETVLILDGVYQIGGPIDWRASGSKIIGQSVNTILQSYSSYTSRYMMRIGGGGSSSITVQYLTFDNNRANNPYPPLLVTGYYNNVQNCQFLNIMQYGLLAYAAHNFQFLNNYVSKAQYGIATGGSSVDGLCTDGLIQGNVIRDTRDAGIKLRWCKGVTVKGNDVDLKWNTWLNGPTSDQNPCGITFYASDGPVINVIVTGNNIHNSGSTMWVSSGQTYYANGVIVQADLKSNWGGYSTSSSGQVISSNSISTTYYGIRSRVSSVTISNNTFSGIYYQNIKIG
jgi:hypothetical protein